MRRCRRAWGKEKSNVGNNVPKFYFENPTDAVIYDFAREVIDVRRVSDRLYNEAVALLGEAGVVDLVTLLGYYTIVSMMLTVFEVAVPTGESSP